MKKKKGKQRGESLLVELIEFLVCGSGIVACMLLVIGLAFCFTPLNLECLGFEIYLLLRMTGISLISFSWLRIFDYLEHRCILREIEENITEIKQSLKNIKNKLERRK